VCVYVCACARACVCCVCVCGCLCVCVCYVCVCEEGAGVKRHEKQTLLDQLDSLQHKAVCLCVCACLLCVVCVSVVCCVRVYGRERCGGNFLLANRRCSYALTHAHIRTHALGYSEQSVARVCMCMCACMCVYVCVCVLCVRVCVWERSGRCGIS